MRFQVTKDKKNKQIIVDATVNRDTGKKDMANTLMVKEYLNANNIKFGDCLKEDYACNRNNIPTGQWIFSMPNVQKTLDKPTESVVSSNRAKRTKKSSA